MRQYGFDKVRVFLGEMNMYVRNALRGALGGVGLSVTGVDNLAPIREAVIRGRVDVLICETEIEGGNFCDFVHGIRHQEIGDNPFLVIIATSGDSSAPGIRKAIDSGVDAVLLKPASAEMIYERLLFLLNHRKPFVVTADYIGPDRRRKQREGTQLVPLIEVPNPLAKARDNIAYPEFLKQVKQFSLEINHQKLERYAYQVSWLAERIVPGYRGNMIGEEMDAHVDRLLFVANDMARRLSANDYGHLAQPASALITVATAIKNSFDEPKEEDLGTLESLAKDFSGMLQQAKNPDKRGATVRHISELMPSRRKPKK